jgi:hypothetical protein
VTFDLGVPDSRAKIERGGRAGPLDVHNNFQPKTGAETKLRVSVELSFGCGWWPATLFSTSMIHPPNEDENSI